MMNRRGFLGAIAAAVAGATLDPERALWVPGARLISVPAPVVHEFGVLMHDIPLDLSNYEMMARYLRPAARAIADRIDAEGLRRARITAPKWPAGTDWYFAADLEPLEGLPASRWVSAYNPVRHCMVGRLDVEVRSA